MIYAVEKNKQVKLFNITLEERMEFLISTYSSKTVKWAFFHYSSISSIGRPILFYSSYPFFSTIDIYIVLNVISSRYPFC